MTTNSEDKSAQIKGLLNMLKQHEAGEIKLTALEIYNIKMFVGLETIKPKTEIN